MSSFQKLVASFSLVLFSFVNMIPLAYAQVEASPAPTITISGSSRRVEAACKVATTRIARIIANSDSRISKRQSYADKRKAKIDSDLAKLTAKSIDTTKLQSDANQLKSLLDTWIADYKTYIQYLKDTQLFACGNSDGQFKAALEKAKTQQNTLKADDKAIREYYNMTYRLDFRTALKSFREKQVQERIDAAKKRAEERKEALKKRLEERKNRRGGSTGTSVTSTPILTETPVPTQ